MKNIALVLAALLVICGCTPIATVTLYTQPAGGKVMIRETAGEVADGGSVELQKGTYTLYAEKEGFSRTSQVLNVDGKNDMVITIPLGTGFSKVKVATLPPDEQVRVEETGQVIQDGETVNLPPGDYTFLLTHAGYRDGVVRQSVDGLANLEVTVPRGEGFGLLEIAVTPPEAIVTLDSITEQTSHVACEIGEGLHTIHVAKKGYFPEHTEVLVTPGSAQTIAVDLKKIPTTGQVTVSSANNETTIFFKGQEVGKGRADLGHLAFGSYTVQAYKQTDSLNRLAGETAFKVMKPGRKAVTVSADHEEYLYEGHWLPLAEAMTKELERYGRSRVEGPVEVIVNLNDSSITKLIQNSELSEALQAVLRIGDRVNFIAPDSQVTVWKRHHQITPEFSSAVVAATGGVLPTVHWQSDPPAARAEIHATENILADIAFALHGRRAETHLIDLTAEQLSGFSEEVYRGVSDGELTLVSYGGAGLRADGKLLEGRGGLVVQNIPAGAKPVILSWLERPARVMLVSDTPVDLNLPQPVALKMQEKRIVKLAENMQVREVIRFSFGPDYSVWRREPLQANGPFSDQIDLAMDEIGPHAVPGQYQRMWLVRIQQGNEIRQRQIAVLYPVGTELQGSASNNFLRRPTE